MSGSTFETYKARLRQELNTAAALGQGLSPLALSGPQGGWVASGGREYLNLSSNNYLGLANDPQVCLAAAQGLSEYGFGLGGGRSIFDMVPHKALEEQVAAFKGREAALVMQTGYDTNLAVLSTLVGEGDTIISDGANHASIVDGARLSKASRRLYAHGDLDALERILKEASGRGTVLIVTDGVFSMDGTLAPLAGITALAEQYGALLYVDDCHGDGVLGQRGSGIVEHLNLHGRVHLEMGCFSKAFGGVGGFIASDKEVIDYLRQRARPFVFATGHLPPMVAAGLVRALELCEAQPERREQLWANTHQLRAGLQALGFDTGQSVTPIIPVMLGDSKTAAGMKQALLKEGVFAQAFAAPVVSEGKARLRCLASAAHTTGDMAFALQAFERAGQASGLL